MHSCGKITAIIPDLIESGVDLFQFDQPRIHGIDVLGGFQDGGVTFWCPVDTQKTFQTREGMAIRAEVNGMLAKLWRGRDGFIAGFTSDEASIGLEPKWQQIACDEFLQRGKRELLAN
jgi:uroporphyrinogen decarboxylase